MGRLEPKILIGMLKQEETIISLLLSVPVVVLVEVGASAAPAPDHSPSIRISAAVSQPWFLDSSDATCSRGPSSPRVITASCCC